MSGHLYVGALAPVRTTFIVTASGSNGFDLTEATSARLVVKFANGVETSWDAAIEAVAPDVAVTATRARLVRVHEEGDIPAGVEGSARIRADITLADFTAPVRTRWRAVEVLPEAV